MLKGFLLLLVLVLLGSNAIRVDRGRSKLVKIRAELDHLEKEVEELAASKSAFLSVGAEGDDNDLVLKDYARFASGTNGERRLSLDLNAKQTDFYRGAKITPGGSVPMLVVIDKRQSAYSESNTFYARIWTGDSVSVSSDCFPAEQNTQLRCRFNDGTWAFEPASRYGLIVAAPNVHHSARPMFWKYIETGPLTDVKPAVDSAAEFVQFFAAECGKQVGNDQGVITGYDLPAVRRRFDSARIGLEASLLAYKRQARLSTEDMQTLDALINAAPEQFAVVARWAVTVDAAWNRRDTFVSSQVTLESSRAIFNGMPELAPMKQTTKLNDQSAQYLKQGSVAGGKALGDLLGKQIKDYYATVPRDAIATDPSLNLDPLINQINSGEFTKTIQGQLFDAVASNDALVNGLNSATEFANQVTNTLAAKGKEVGDYFSRLLTFNKKKTAVVNAVNDEVKAKGQLKPGEDSVAKTMFNTAAEADAKNLDTRADALKIKNKFRFSPKLGMPGDGGVLTAVKQLNLGWRLNVQKGATSGFFDVDVKIKDPFDKNKAQATVAVSVEGQRDLGNGVIRAGVKAEATILGLYQTPEAQGLILTSFITYGSKDGRLQTGFFATVNVPLKDGAPTRFNEGTELSLRGQLTWSPSPQTKFTAYAELHGSARGSYEYGAGARFEHSFSKSGSFFIDAGVSGGHREYGGMDRSDARVMVGLSFKF